MPSGIIWGNSSEYYGCVKEWYDGALLSWHVSDGTLMLTAAKLASIFFIIFFLLDYLQKNLFAGIWAWKTFLLLKNSIQTPCSCWSLYCSKRYVYASQMNVAKPFSALIGVCIKVISSAVLVLTKVYTQTTTTAKTFTLINASRSVKCRKKKPNWRKYVQTWEHFLCLTVKQHMFQTPSSKNCMKNHFKAVLSKDWWF